MVVAFARYCRDQAFSVLRGNGTFVAAMTAGSITARCSARCCSVLSPISC
jgi:hypothetical protein